MVKASPLCLTGKVKVRNKIQYTTHEIINRYQNLPARIIVKKKLKETNNIGKRSVMAVLTIIE